MSIASRMVIITLVVFLVLLAGGVVLQIHLSRREGRWPGLILPMVTFCWSLLLVLSSRDTGMLAVLTVLLAGNIPTLVLLGIYWAAREKRRVRERIEKMRIEDL